MLNIERRQLQSLFVMRAVSNVGVVCGHLSANNTCDAGVRKNILPICDDFVVNVFHVFSFVFSGLVRPVMLGSEFMVRCFSLF